MQPPQEPATEARLLENAWPYAYRVAWSIVRERTAAEDAVQSACARALASMHTLRSPERFRAWFYRIVVNEAKQRLRNAARESEVLLPVAYEERGLRDERIDLVRAIEQLSATLRVTVLLYYYVGLNGGEIAAAMQTSPVAVRLRLMLARRRLRALLDVSGRPHAERAERLANEQ